MTWRETKANARGVVHDTMKVQALLIAALPYDSNAGPLGQFTVRVHEKQANLGDQAGTSLNSAERYEPIPKLIFWRAELTAAVVTLRRNMVVSVSDGEAYRIGPVQPHDQETISVEVTRLPANEVTGLPLPV